MRERPIGDLVDALRACGAPIEYEAEEGFPPVIVHGRGLRGGPLHLPPTPSSQFISALLMVAPYATGDALIEAEGPISSAPYLAMTVQLMDRFGVSAVCDNEKVKTSKNRNAETAEADFSTFRLFDFSTFARFIVPAPQRYQATNYAVEPDATNATYFLAAPAVAGGHVTVRGLGSQSLQGDVGFVDVLARMGCSVELAPDSISVSGPAGERLRGIDVDLNAMPDTVPTLAVLALFADGPTRICNVAHLRIKETDRLKALSTELGKLGSRVEEHEDGLTIYPIGRLLPATIDTYDDHRMAMSFALAGLRCPELIINNPGCCEKSFPDFFARFAKMLETR